MPLELGVFIGAKKFGNKKQQIKNCLILDRDRYRYQAFISDISGHDIKNHNLDSEILIRQVRDWLNSVSEKKIIMPGGKQIIKRFNMFKSDLPALCNEIPITLKELTYLDYSNMMELWLQENSPKNLT